MTSRRFSSPWDIEEHNRSCFVVRDNNGQVLAYVYLDRARKANGCELAHTRRGAAHSGQYRQAAGDTETALKFKTPGALALGVLELSLILRSRTCGRHRGMGSHSAIP
jgi:hypothetical protein